MRKISGRFGAVARVATLPGMMLAAAIVLSAQESVTFTSLHSFNNFDGAYPYAALVQATNGNFYGTTVEGGANGYGTLFQITPSGTLMRSYSFCSLSGCADGSNPYAGLIQAASGFYGTTFGGGTSDFGTLFTVSPIGRLMTLHSFQKTDGFGPAAGLVEGTDGNFYGTTAYGGANNDSLCDNDGCGTVFKITQSGTLTTPYNFCSLSGCKDGAGPEGALVQNTNGDFYGTTPNGGANAAGTIFKLTPGGTLTTLYDFCSQSGCADGSGPYPGLVLSTNGNFYGTTYYGGVGSGSCTDTLGCGTVFEITPSGTLTTLHSFCSQSGCTDGSAPYALLIQATDGNLYGTQTMAEPTVTMGLSSKSLPVAL